MVLIKRWMSKYGISAQFYCSDNMYFLDYSGCRVSVVIPVINNRPVIPSGVPATYRRFILKYFSN